MDHTYLAYEIMQEFSRLDFTKPKEAKRIICDSRNITDTDREKIFKDSKPFKVVDNWMAIKLSKAGKVQAYYQDGWRVLALYETNPITLVKAKQKNGTLELYVKQHCSWKENKSDSALEITDPATYQEFTKLTHSASENGYDYHSLAKLANKHKSAPIPLWYGCECLMFGITLPLNEHLKNQIKIEAEIYHGTPIEEKKKTVGPYDRTTLITLVTVKKSKQELTLPDKLF